MHLGWNPNLTLCMPHLGALWRMHAWVSNELLDILGITFFGESQQTAEYNKQLLDEVEHDIMNYQNRGLCYLPKPKAEADNTDTRF